MTSGLVIIPTQRAHSNHAAVARSIGIDIIAGRYAEGTRLPGDAELTATFGVSRPVLRESIKTLVAKGLLTTKARVGTAMNTTLPAGRNLSISSTTTLVLPVPAVTRMAVSTGFGDATEAIRTALSFSFASTRLTGLSL